MFEDDIQDLEAAERAALLAIIDLVRRLAPDAEEGRSYGMPAFRYRGKPLLGLTATKKHLALHPFSPAVVEAVRDELNGFDLSKGTVRFTADHPVPDAVVAQMVRARLAEITG